MPTKARVALHFHPDFDLWGRPVLERSLEDDAYLSQFATGTSNGGGGPLDAPEATRGPSNRNPTASSVGFAE